MKKTQRNIASFLLRFTQDLWQDETGDPRIQWRGRISHVQGDDEAPFTDFSEAVAFIQHHLTRLTLDAASGDQAMDQEKVLRESFKLWEEFASNYSNMMVEAVERTVKQSQQFQTRMEEAVQQSLQGWQPVPSARLSEQIAALQQQIETLSEHVASLENELKNRTES